MLSLKCDAKIYIYIYIIWQNKSKMSPLLFFYFLHGFGSFGPNSFCNVFRYIFGKIKKICWTPRPPRNVFFQHGTKICMFFYHIFTDLLEGICVCEYLLEGTFVFEFNLEKCTVCIYVYINHSNPKWFFIRAVSCVLMIQKKKRYSLTDFFGARARINRDFTSKSGENGRKTTFFEGKK